MTDAHGWKSGHWINAGCSFSFTPITNEIQIKIKSKAASNSAIGITSNSDNCKGDEWMYQFKNAETYYVANSGYGSGTAWRGELNLHRKPKGTGSISIVSSVYSSNFF